MTPRALRPLAGTWEGLSRLHLPEPGNARTFEGASTLRLEVNPAYADVGIHWTYEGEPQVGRLIVAGDEASDRVEGAWVDSWHQSSSVLRLAGTGLEGDAVRLDGSFPAPEGPDWGWRIELQPQPEALRLLMTVVTPEGEEEWAVDATYRRAGVEPFEGP